SDVLADLIRQEGALLDDLVPFGRMAHHLVRQETGDPRIGHDRHEAGRRLRGGQHLDRFVRDAPPELGEVEGLHQLPSDGAVLEIEGGLAAVAFSGDSLAGDPYAHLPPLQACAPGVRELERRVGVGIGAVRVRDSVPPLGAAYLHRGGDLLLPGDVARLDPDLRFHGDRSGRHLAELRRRHAGRRPAPRDRDGLPSGLDQIGGPAGRTGGVTPRAVEEGPDAPAATVDLVDALDLLIGYAHNERRAILPADVAEVRARFLEGPHRGGHELRHARPRRRAAIKGFRADRCEVSRRRLEAFERSMRRYILLWGYYFISRGPSRGRGTPYAVDAPAVSRSAVLPDGNGELAEEAVRARRERRRAPGALVRCHHRDREQRPERPWVRAVPGDLRRGRRRVR